MLTQGIVETGWEWSRFITRQNTSRLVPGITNRNFNVHVSLTSGGGGLAAFKVYPAYMHCFYHHICEFSVYGHLHTHIILVLHLSSKSSIGKWGWVYMEFRCCCCVYQLLAAQLHCSHSNTATVYRGSGISSGMLV